MKVNKKVESFFYFFISVFIILIVWESVSRLRVVNPSLISKPSEIFLNMISLFNEKTKNGNSVLLTHIYSSLYRLFFSFLIATGVGISIGILMGRNKYVYRFFDPLITVAMPIPGIAWAPIFMLWLGFGDPTIVAVGTLAAFFPIVYSTAIGVRSIEKRMVWSALEAGANRKMIFLKVLLPSSMPYVLTGLKLGLARGWRTIIAVEMIAASLWGLGFMIFDAREYLQPSIIYGGIMILAVIFYLLENLLKLIEEKTVQKWGMVKEEFK